MANVVEINDIEELQGQRMLWDALWPQTPQASLFQTRDWLTTYWKHFGAGQKLRVLIIRSCGKPLGIVPLCVRRMKYRIGSIRTLTYPLDDWGTKYGPIGPNPAVSMVLAMQHIRRTRRDWDRIELPWIGSVAFDSGRPGRALRIAGMEPRKYKYHGTSVVDLSGGWESYLASKSSKDRGEIRRLHRRWLAQADLEFVRHRPRPARAGDGDPRWDLYAMCEQIARQSWQAKSSDGNTMTHERVRGFLRDVHVEASRLGMVDMNLLLDGGRPVAFAYNYHHAGRVFGLRTGFDAAEASHGRGTDLLIRSLYDSCLRGDQMIDAGIGDYPFKRRFRTHTEQTYRLTHLPLVSFRSQAVRLTQWMKHNATRVTDGKPGARMGQTDG